MKKIIVILSFLFCISGYYACTQHATHPTDEVSRVLLKHTDEFIAQIDELSAAASKTNDVAPLREKFLAARRSYKQIEWIAEYCAPVIARQINGPNVPETDLEPEGPVTVQPEGLQAIEAILYGNYTPAQRQQLQAQLVSLHNSSNMLKGVLANLALKDWHVFDAVKLQMFRIITLGISGFDTPLCLSAISESAASIESLREVLHCYGNADSVAHILTAAINYTKTYPDFNSFDRAVFITDFANPATRSITALSKQLHVVMPHYNRLLNQDAATLFEKNAFNINAYLPTYADTVTPARIALGKKLFEDPALSGNSTRSCRSCHMPEKAFTDGLPRNIVMSSNELLKRNTPTLINAAMQPFLFYDMRSRTLEEQALDVLQNTHEMHGSITMATKILWEDSSYRLLFAEAYPQSKRASISGAEILNAIGSYIRSLTLLNSRFDKYMNGDKSALSASEISGFNLFMGKAKCGTCHYMPLFNGSFPPMYNTMETEVLGVPAVAGDNVIDSDMGRYDVIHAPHLKHAFKISTVRNAALTAPYMHNGVYNTLGEVIDFYNKGGGAGMGIAVDNQTLSADKLDLTPQQKADIISFINSLNSTY